MESERFKIEVKEGGKRLDVFLASSLGISRTRAKKLIESGFVTLSGSIPKPARRLKPGEVVEGVIPPPDPFDLKPQAIPIGIVYQDDDIAVINKPSGLVVHPAPGNPHTTLVNALLYHMSKLSSGYSQGRPGIVHRLDAETSGVMVVAKNDESHRRLSEMFKERRVKKLYRAIVWGKVEKPGSVDMPIGRHPVHRKKMAVLPQGRAALTFYRPLSFSEEMSYLEVEIKTGRTHQIRVHMSHLGHPVVGDRLYGRKADTAERLMLHAFSLSFEHPRTGELLTFEVEEPKDFKDFLRGKGLL